VSGSYLQLDDETLSVVDGRNVDELAAWIVKSLLPDSAAYAASRERFPKQLVVASNDIFTHFSRYATEVVARIALDYGSKTVKKGALFYQEQLPAESLGYSVLLMNESRAGGEDKSSSTESLQKLCDILKFTTLQVGGDETTGKGFCAVRLCRGEC
jgi:CRISPR-associated protein Cmr4